jgi:mannosyl-oligosaccharide alpha-1,2-mannosidase
MHWNLCAVVAGIFLTKSTYAVPVNGSSSYIVNTQKADAVREAFRHAWGGYKQYAFPHDELHPVSNGFGDSRNGWGASAIDALSTAIIMG